MGVISTQGFSFKLIANGEQLDLFADEDIFVSDNVTGLFDLGILPADFTRQISLPGTKKNNAFFEHYYDISIESPFLFATNTKVDAYFDFDGILISNGYLQLNKVNVISNKFIDSYEVTIYGGLSSFAREINRNFLTDLTSLSVYNHTSSFTNISASWAGDLFSGSIVYPLAEYGQKLQYTPGDNLFGMDDTEGALSVQDFKPAIKSKIVFDAIFNEAGYTYKSEFINDGGLDDIYLVCNRALRYPVYSDINLETFGQILISPFSGSGQTDFNVSQTSNTILNWYNVQKDPSNVMAGGLTYILNTPSALRGNLTLNVNLSGSLGGPTINLRILDNFLSVVSDTSLVNFNDFFVRNANAMFANGATGQNETYEISTEFNTQQLPTGSYFFAIYWDDAFSSPYNNFTFTLDPGGQPKSRLEITKVLNASDDKVINIPLNMPFGTSGIKQIDFITSIQKKFNLVIYPSKTKSREFIIETFNRWYKMGEVKDFNKYINLDDKIEVIPANSFAVNELNFGDVLDQDYVSQQFSKGANREYGKTYYTDLENFFSQGKFEVKSSVSSTPLLQISGTGLSGSVNGLNPSQQIPFVGVYPISTVYNVTDLCNNPTSYDNVPIYTPTGVIAFGSTLYADAGGTLPYTGYRLVYSTDFCTVYSIDASTATVNDFGTTCPVCI
jgi:hypothetical protein